MGVDGVVLAGRLEAVGEEGFGGGVVEGGGGGGCHGGSFLSVFVSLYGFGGLMIFFGGFRFSSIELAFSFDDDASSRVSCLVVCFLIAAR